MQDLTGERMYSIEHMLAKCLQHVGIPDAQQPPGGGGREVKRPSAAADKFTAQPLRIVEFPIDAASCSPVILKRLHGEVTE
jgi:hypothetical protein